MYANSQTRKREREGWLRSTTSTRNIWQFLICWVPIFPQYSLVFSEVSLVLPLISASKNIENKNRNPYNGPVLGESMGSHLGSFIESLGNQ